MAKTTTTISGHRFTDYSLDDLRREARFLAKSKFINNKPVKLESFVVRVTNSGAQIVAKVSGDNGEIERGITL